MSKKSENSVENWVAQEIFDNLEDYTGCRIEIEQFKQLLLNKAMDNISCGLKRRNILAPDWIEKHFKGVMPLTHEYETKYGCSIAHEIFSDSNKFIYRIVYLVINKVFNEIEAWNWQRYGSLTDPGLAGYKKSFRIELTSILNNKKIIFLNLDLKTIDNIKRAIEKKYDVKI